MYYPVFTPFPTVCINALSRIIMYCHFKIRCNFVAKTLFCYISPTQGLFPKIHRIFVLNSSLIPFFHVCNFGIYIHRGFYVRMSHNGLDYLDIGFLFTEPCAKGMPQVMAGKMWQYNRLPFSLFSLSTLPPHYNSLKYAESSG